MPQLLPFAGLRPGPAAGPLGTFVCPPYDVITASQRQALLERSPHNVVRVELPDGDYGGAAQLLDEWKRTGVLERQDPPALYGYRMSYQAPDGQWRQTLGVMGALVLEPPGQGILPHEHTTPKAKSDRLELIRATQANTSPIWCLCSEPGLAAAIGPAAIGPVPTGPVPSGPGPAGPDGLARAVDDDGTVHEIWAVTAPEAHARTAAVVGARPLLVADGHHRYETALAYQAERRAGTTMPAARPAGYDAVLCLVVELSEEHLQVLAIHRVISGLPPGTDVVGALGPAFELTPTSAEGATVLAALVGPTSVALVTRQGTWLGAPRPDEAGAGGTTGGAELASARADAAARALPPHRLDYEHDVAAAVAAVRTGAADAAILCRPATVGQIARTAHGGARMPPKTTFFWPKPRTGMVLRDFAEGDSL